ncbi:MAG: branched-chain amino acid ABC transporter substrate-binding protein [Deltaproteobacteria bacterium]|nr:branched-chain amino acid ABC transporter substrate-binding protein [Deltaproteobacteria bacterium]
MTHQTISLPARLILPALLLGLFSAALGGCEKKIPDNVIRVGLAGPLTGPNAKFGEQLLKGAQMAAQQINAQGGILGKKVEIVEGDDACEAKQARSVANRMVDEQVSAVIGHFCSSSTIPASEVYAERNLLMITPGSTNPQVTDRGYPVIFRTCGRDDQQGKVAAAFIANTLKPRAVAIVHDKTTYGQGLADAMRAELNGRYHVKEVMYEGIALGDKDFNALITKMKGAKVDLIYYGGVSTEAGLLARQAAEQRLGAKFVSGDGVMTPSFPETAGPAAEGVLMTFGPDPRQNKAAQSAVKAFQDIGYDPESYTLYSYAAAEIIFQALAANQATRDGKVLGDYIRSRPASTVLGVKTFDTKGDPLDAGYVMYRWAKNKSGGFEYVRVK